MDMATRCCAIPMPARAATKPPSSCPPCCPLPAWSARPTLPPSPPLPEGSIPWRRRGPDEGSVRSEPCPLRIQGTIGPRSGDGVDGRAPLALLHGGFEGGSAPPGSHDSRAPSAVSSAPLIPALLWGHPVMRTGRRSSRGLPVMQPMTGPQGGLDRGSNDPAADPVHGGVS